MRPTSELEEKIPSELYELIINQAADTPYDHWRDRAQVLSSAALVCRSFREMAHRRLFEIITILPDPESPYDVVAYRLSSLVNLIMTNTSSRTGLGLISYARKFSLQLCDMRLRILPHFRRKGPLSFILKKLFQTGPPQCMISIGVRVLGDLQLGDLNTTTIDWANDISNDCQTTLLKVFRLPRLLTLRLAGFTNIPKDFLSGTFIKHVRFSRLSVNPVSDTSNLRIQNPTDLADALLASVQLESIDTDQPILHFLDMTSGLLPHQWTLHKLKYFKTYLRGLCAQERAAILKGAASSLESLEVEVAPLPNTQLSTSVTLIFSSGNLIVLLVANSHSTSISSFNCAELSKLKTLKVVRSVFNPLFRRVSVSIPQRRIASDICGFLDNSYPPPGLPILSISFMYRTNFAEDDDSPEGPSTSEIFYDLCCAELDLALSDTRYDEVENIVLHIDLTIITRVRHHQRNFDRIKFLQIAPSYLRQSKFPVLSRKRPERFQIYINIRYEGL